MKKQKTILNNKKILNFVIIILLFILSIYLFTSIIKYYLCYNIYLKYSSYNNLNNYYFKITDYKVKSDKKENICTICEVYYKDSIAKMILTTKLEDSQNIGGYWIDFNKQISYSFDQVNQTSSKNNFLLISNILSQQNFLYLKPNVYDEYNISSNIVFALFPLYNIKNKKDTYEVTYPGIKEIINKDTGLLKKKIEYYKYSTTIREYEMKINTVTDEDVIMNFDQI